MNDDGRGLKQRRRRDCSSVWNTLIIALERYNSSGIKWSEARLVSNRPEPEAQTGISYERAAFVLPIHRLQSRDEGGVIVRSVNLITRRGSRPLLKDRDAFLSPPHITRCLFTFFLAGKRLLATQNRAKQAADWRHLATHRIQGSSDFVVLNQEIENNGSFVFHVRKPSATSAHG